MQSANKISVITVCLNEVVRIRQTAESIASQTRQDFEWIVKDGGSTDGTLEVLNEYKEHISVLLSGSDEGIYDAMNQAAARATGDWLLFLNGGDRLASLDVISKVAAALDPAADICTGDYCFEHLSGKIELRNSAKRPTSLHQLYSSCPVHCASFIRTSFFRTIGAYDTSYKIMGDYDWFLRAILGNDAKVSGLQHTITVFNGEGVSSTNKGSRLHRLEDKRIRRMHFPFGYSIRWAINEVVGRFQTTMRKIIG